MNSIGSALVAVNPAHRALTAIEFVGGLLLLLTLAALVLMIFGGIGAVIDRLGLKLFLMPIALIVIGGIFVNGIAIGIGVGLIVLMIIGLMVKAIS